MVSIGTYHAGSIMTYKPFRCLSNGGKCQEMFGFLNILNTVEMNVPLQIEKGCPPIYSRDQFVLQFHTTHCKMAGPSTLTPACISVYMSAISMYLYVRHVYYFKISRIYRNLCEARIMLKHSISNNEKTQ